MVARSITALEEAMLALVRALPASVWLKDADGCYRFVQLQPSRHLAIVGDPVGRTAADLFPPSAAADLIAMDRRVLETGAVVTEPMWLPDTGDGRVQLAVMKFPVATAAGPAIGGLSLDITALSAANWEASTYRQILDSFNDMIAVKGPRSKLRWANRAFLEAYGMSNDDLQGLIDAPFVEPDVTQKYVRDDALVFSTGRTLDIPEEVMLRPDGSVRTCHTVKSPIFDDAGHVVMTVAVIRDITDKKRLELELGQAQKLESIGRLAGGMAHEINTPVQFIGDQAQFAQGAFQDLLALLAHYQRLLAGVEAGTATAADGAVVRAAEDAADLAFLQERLPPALNAILEGTHRVAHLVQAMKEFGHPDEGVPRPADVNAAIRTTVTVAANECKRAADVVLDLGELPPVCCNISELNQVFLNLLVNAAHAIADGGAARGTIRITTRMDGDDLAISIADTGCGIPESVQSRIFDPFFTTKAIGRGTGQGLAIARMIVVEKHRGSLTFETAPGQGTTFHVRIPRAGASADEGAAAAA